MKLPCCAQRQEGEDLHLGSTTAPSAAVHEKSCVQATPCSTLDFSMIRPPSSWFLPHGSRTGSCAIIDGLFSVGDRERPQGAPSSVVHWSPKYEDFFAYRLSALYLYWGWSSSINSREAVCVRGATVF